MGDVEDHVIPASVVRAFSVSSRGFEIFATAETTGTLPFTGTHPYVIRPCIVVKPSDGLRAENQDVGVRKRWGCSGNLQVDPYTPIVNEDILHFKVCLEELAAS